MVWDAFGWSIMLGVVIGILLGAIMIGWAESHYGKEDR